ncbi:32573_t:CDS:2 [Gigaspora margarita]|uniref:32573_t:CDS:1 n=1 Tax=Gigaspora margarita TaxID=4874 RepID=A0ABM8VVP4_GIGMA|nr:32573_t:CDS:2 [Gigaspora margarita]
MNTDLTRLVEWKAIQHNLEKAIKGKTPGWITIVQNEIRGRCNPANNPKGINQFAMRSLTEETKWVVIKEAVIGRVVSIEQNIVQIAHWKEEANSGVLKKCDGCKINKDRNKKKKKGCIIYMHKRNMAQILVNKDKRLRMDYKELVKALPHRGNGEIILREPFISHDMRKSYEISEHFNKVNKGTKILLEKYGEHIYITNENWPSIQKALLSTIAMLAVVMPNAAKINIKTDIKEMKQIVRTLTKDAKAKYEDLYKYKLWAQYMGARAICLAKRTKFDINLKDKMEAMKDNAQRLTIEIDYQNWVPNLMAVQLNRINICHGVRRLVRYICNAKILIQFYRQNWIQELNVGHKVNWELTYDYINWGCKPTTRHTSMQTSVLKAFKALDDEVYWLWCTGNEVKWSDIVEKVLNEIEKKHKKQFENKKAYVKHFVEMYGSGSELTLPNRIIKGSFIKDRRGTNPKLMYAIKHGINPKEFSIITEAEKNRWTTGCFHRDLERDICFYHGGIERKEDSKKYCKFLTDQKRLVGEELLRHSILKSGLSTACLNDLIEEWKKIYAQFIQIFFEEKVLLILHVNVPPIPSKPRSPISILSKDSKKRQQHIIKMVLEHFSYLILKHSFKNNCFDFNKSVLCPLCNKNYKKENIRNYIEGE